MRPVLAGLVILGAILTLVAFVMVFVFAYTAVFRTGTDDDLTGAAFLTFVLTLVIGAATCFGAFAVTDDDLWGKR